MPDASNFTRLPEPDGAAMLTFEFKGVSVPAREGDTVAAALLAAGHSVFRATPVSGEARGPYCMMGVCFDCLVVIDGRPNRQACQVLVRDGMCVRPMQGARAMIESDDG